MITGYRTCVPMVVISIIKPRERFGEQRELLGRPDELKPPVVAEAKLTGAFTLFDAKAAKKLREWSGIAGRDGRERRPWR